MRSAVDDELRAERVDQLLERDHRAGRREVDGGDHLARLVAHGRGDRVQLGRELLVVDREARRGGSRSSSSRSAFLLVIVLGPCLVSFICAISSRCSSSGRFASSSLPIAVQ